MAPSHGHIAPTLKKPWRLWCCAQCTPEIFDVMMTSDNDPHSRARATVTCPFCLYGPKYKDGRIARHLDDGVECRGIGLSLPVAKDLFVAIRQGVPAERFFRESMTKRTAARVALGIPVAEVPKPSITQRLHWLRLDAGLTQGQLAKLGGMHLQSISEWERGVQPPRALKVVGWAGTLGHQLAFAHPVLGPFRRFASITEACWWLGEQRRNQEIRLTTLAERIDWKPETLRNRESGKTSNSITLAELNSWTESLDFRLDLVESEEHA